MEKSAFKRHPRLFLTVIGLIGLVILLLLNFFTPESSSPEWIYTLEWINKFGIAIFTGLGAFLGGWCLFKIAKSRYSKMVWTWCAVLCAIMFAIPFAAPDYLYIAWPYQYFLSVCWACALLAGSIALFGTAANKPSFIASLLCLAGSVAVGLAAVELALLFSSQTNDAMEDKSAESKYMRLEKGVPEYQSRFNSQCGLMPASPGSPPPAFHRYTKYGDDLYDVKYTFNSRGWRIVPEAKTDAENDLLLFGCSYTFGNGLEDDETWAWKLAKLLGPDWRLENYAANGWSVNQMLCLLEHRLIEKPTGTHRYAVFLSIDHHIRRNEFFPHTPHYEFNEAGEAVAGGKPRFNWAEKLHLTFNGSQLARQTGFVIASAAMKNPVRETDLYLVMLKKSAAILAKEYNTKLIVLLWPDMEKIRPRLEEMGIPVILAQPMLKDWDTPPDEGYKYRINPKFEFHPNNKATTEIAAGLAHYFRELAQTR